MAKSGQTLDENQKISQNYSSSIPLDTLCELKNKGLICDSILRTKDGGEFQVHRPVLVTCSPYFEALYTSPINKFPRKEIIIPDVSAKMLKNIIQFAYTRHNDIFLSNVRQLILVADQFNVTKMMNSCCNFLISHINKESCIDIWKFSRLYNCKKMEKKCFRFILINISEVAMKDEYLTLSVDEVIQILSQDKLNVKSEDIVWEIIIRWIDYDPNNRSSYIDKLMPCVRLGLIDPEYFIEKIKLNKYVCDNKNCRPIVIEAIKCLFDLDVGLCNRNISKSELQRPRIPYGVIFVIGGWSGESATNLMETYDIKTDSWMMVLTTENPDGPRAYHKCAVVGHKIYIIGGFDGTEYFNACCCFDTSTSIWREIAPMYSQRCYISVAVINNIIYAMGGFNGTRRQNSAEKYNCDTNQWELIAPMNFERSDACATELDGYVYIVGGFNGTDFLNSVEYYNPETNQWTVISAMRTFRSGVSCISHDGILYVFGGFNGTTRLSSGEKYNPNTKRWHPLPDMSLPRSNFAVVVLEDSIFVLGGYNGSTTVSNVEYYDIKGDQWIQAEDMYIARSALSACVVKDLPNVTDYITKREARLA